MEGTTGDHYICRCPSSSEIQSLLEYRTEDLREFPQQELVELYNSIPRWSVSVYCARIPAVSAKAFELTNAQLKSNADPLYPHISPLYTRRRRRLRSVGKNLKQRVSMMYV